MLALLALFVAGLAREAGAAASITPEEFDRLVTSSAAKSVVVFFYSPNCHFCTLFDPIFNETVNDLRDVKDIVMTRVNCKEFNEFCEAQDITGYPTIRLYRDMAFSEIRRRPYESWNFKLQILERSFSTRPNLD